MFPYLFFFFPFVSWSEAYKIAIRIHLWLSVQDALMMKKEKENWIKAFC